MSSDELAALVASSLHSALDFSDVGLSEDGARRIAAALEPNHSLTSLDLSRCNLGDEGATPILAVLERNTTLTSLTMDCNGMRQSASGVQQLLANNSTLTHLSLWANSLHDSGVELLVAGLEQNTSLTSLNLRNNDMTPEGMEPLAWLLGHNKSLLRLNLSLNDISLTGMQTLAPALRGNTTLTSLDLEDAFDARGLPPDHEVMRELTAVLRSALTSNFTLTELRGVEVFGVGDLLERNAYVMHARLQKVRSYTSCTQSTVQVLLVAHSLCVVYPRGSAAAGLEAVSTRCLAGGL